jgi:hypothetical protein
MDQLVSAVAASCYLPSLSGPAATTRLQWHPEAGAVYDGGFSHRLPCPPGVYVRKGVCLRGGVGEGLREGGGWKRGRGGGRRLPALTTLPPVRVPDWLTKGENSGVREEVRVYDGGFSHTLPCASGAQEVC